MAAECPDRDVAVQCSGTVVSISVIANFEMNESTRDCAELLVVLSGLFFWML